MVSVLAEVKILRFWPKTMEGVLLKFLSAFITPHWKVLQS